MSKSEIKTVKEPDTVIFISSSANLGLSIRNGDKKEKYNFQDGKLELSKTADKERLELLERYLDDQWLKDEKGYVTDENGNKIVKPNKMVLPVWKNDVFNAMVAKEPVRIKMPDGDFVEVTPEKISELISSEKTNINKSKKDEK